MPAEVKLLLITLLASVVLGAGVAIPLCMYRKAEDERMTAAGFVWVPTVHGHREKVKAEKAP